MTIITWLPAPHANPDPKLALDATSVVAFRSRDKGFTWDYAGIVLSAAAVPQSEEGPNENDITLIDGNKIACVVRLDAGDGQKTHPYRPYAVVTSDDGGFTWSRAEMLPEHVGVFACSNVCRMLQHISHSCAPLVNRLCEAKTPEHPIWCCRPLWWEAYFNESRHLSLARRQLAQGLEGL